MSHRTQITLTNAQYARLQRESARTGLGLAELVRRALAVSLGDPTVDAADALVDSFGAWRDRTLEGDEYVDRLRRGMARRLGE